MTLSLSFSLLCPSDSHTTSVATDGHVHDNVSRNIIVPLDDAERLLAFQVGGPL